jgi:hypothetical protein
VVHGAGEKYGLRTIRYEGINPPAKDSYEVVGKAKVGALYCASPALVGKTLYFRTDKSVAAYQFQ